MVGGTRKYTGLKIEFINFQVPKYENTIVVLDKINFQLLEQRLKIKPGLRLGMSLLQTVLWVSEFPI